MLPPHRANAAYLVKDIDPSPGIIHTCGGIGEIVASGSTLFMSVDDCTHGQELWASDGTPEGTRLVRDIAPGALDSWPSAITSLNGRLLFFAEDGVNHRTLWASDGTEAGTQPLTDLAPDVRSGGPARLLQVGDVGLFAANDGAYGVDLWRTDGTAEGTTPFMHFPGTMADWPDVALYEWRTIVTPGGLLFTVGGFPGSDIQLWVTDGTADGTRMIRGGIHAGVCTPSHFGRLGTRVLFAADDGEHGCEPWVTDLTPAGTHLLADLNQHGAFGAHSWPHNFSELDGKAIFFATDDRHGDEPWITDGTAAGTTLLADLVPGVGGSNAYLAFANAQVAYLLAYDGIARYALWRTDGTTTGTVPVPSGFPYLAHGYHPDQPVSAVYLPEDGRIGLIEGDGTPEGRPPFYVFDAGSEPRRFTRVGETVFFTRLNPETTDLDAELWRTDGTAEGTRRVATPGVVTNGTFDSSPRSFGEFHGRLVFAAHTPEQGTELWISDGTADGTRLVRDISPGPDDSSPTHFVSASDVVYFVARDPDHGFELWHSDGTEAGTAIVHDIHPGRDSSDPLDLIVLGNRLFFIANDGTHGDELWVSDGTSAGTTLVADIREGPVGALMRDESVLPRDDGYAFSVGLSGPLQRFGQRLTFIANDGTHGNELWVSDGSVRGTHLVEDIRPGVEGSADRHELVVVGDEAPRIYLAADDGRRGEELWVSDGTAGGTRLAVQLMPGPQGSYIRSLVSTLGQLFFFATDDDYDTNLVRSDGTPAGTTVLAGVTGARRMRVAGSNVFFDLKYQGFFRLDASSGDVARIDLGPTISDDGGDPDFIATVGNVIAGVVRITDFVCPANVAFATCRVQNDTGFEPFVSDGSQAGTRTLGDLAPGPRSSAPRAAVAIGSLLFFDAWTREYGRELWAERLGPDCGNGVLDAGEDCDDGAANGNDACCSADCQPIDGDHDGKCDRDDPCTAGTPMRARIQLSGNGRGGATDGRSWIGGRLENVLASDASLNPPATGVRVILRSRTATVLDALVPPGVAKKGEVSGWRTTRRGREWVFSSDRAHAPAGIRRVLVRRRSRSVTVVVWGVSGAYGIRAADLPLEATIALDPAVVPSRQCGVASFRRRRCNVDQRANTIACR